jgi:aminoglycoside 6'-N-acetyltransferase
MWVPGAREPGDLASVEAEYGPGVDGAEPTHVFLIEHGGRPVGWIRWFRWSDYPEHALQLGAELSSAGIDLAINELTMTGLGTVAISRFLRPLIFRDPNLTAVIADPEESNIRSLRAFEKVGFTVTHRLQLAGENFNRRAMRVDRALMEKRWKEL